MPNDGFNIKKTKGAAFTAIDSSAHLSSNEPTIKKNLNTVLPLSPREGQCLQLYLEGKSAQATGPILGISQRTVESYFESIKRKLGCRSKAELLSLYGMCCTTF